MDRLNMLHPPSSGGAEAADLEAARQLHGAVNARPRSRPRDDDDEGEEVKIRLLAVVAASEGEKRRRVMKREAEGAAEARGPSERGVGAQRGGNGGRGASRFRGIYKDKMAISKPWMAKIGVTEDGKGRQINIASFAQEEDAARAYDRVSIAKLGHAEAKTNFPAAEYRAEWAELEALGVDGAVARERQRLQ